MKKLMDDVKKYGHGVGIEYTGLTLKEVTDLSSLIFGLYIGRKVGKWNSPFDLRKYQKFLRPWEGYQLENMWMDDTYLRDFYTNSMGKLTLYASKEGVLSYNRFKDMSSFEWLGVGRDKGGTYNLHARVNGNKNIERKIREL